MKEKQCERSMIVVKSNTQTELTPENEVKLFFDRKWDYLVYIFFFNETKLLPKQLERLRGSQISGFDVMLGDDGSTEEVISENLMKRYKIRGITRLLKNEGLSQNIKVGIKWCLSQSYKGVIFMNGNNRDNPEAIPLFINELEKGYGYVQGSRFIKGGEHINTPWKRYLAIRFFHAPVFSLLAGHRMTDTTNGYRAFSTEFLSDRRVRVFQKCFVQYEIEQYLAWKAIRLGYKIKETPVKREYPEKNYTSHIRSAFGWALMLKPLLMLLLRRYG